MLRIELCAYPNPAMEYGVFFIGRDEIGRADKVDGGWRLFGRRKVLPTDEMAAKAMLDKELNRLRDAEQRTRKLLDGLRIYCGGRLPYNACDKRRIFIASA